MEDLRYSKEYNQQKPYSKHDILDQVRIIWSQNLLFMPDWCYPKVELLIKRFCEEDQLCGYQ